MLKQKHTHTYMLKQKHIYICLNRNIYYRPENVFPSLAPKCQREKIIPTPFPISCVFGPRSGWVRCPAG